MVEIPHSNAVVVVNLKAVPDICPNKGTGHTTGVAQQVIGGIGICINAGITEVATVFLEYKVLAIVQPDRVLTDRDRKPRSPKN